MAQQLTLIVERVERGRAWCRLQDALGQVIGRSVQTISAGGAAYRETHCTQRRRRKKAQAKRSERWN
jgi:hypothetical protein